MIGGQGIVNGLAAIPIVVAAMGFLPAHAKPNEEKAQQFISKLVDDAISIVKRQSEGSDQLEDRLLALLDERFDMPVITGLVLGRHWHNASARQKEAFSQVFGTHIVNVLDSHFERYEDQGMMIKKVIRLNETDIVIFTEVAHEFDPQMQVAWQVRASDDGFRAVDMTSNGASLVRTKHSEYRSVLARDTIDSLIKRLDELNSHDDE